METDLAGSSGKAAERPEQHEVGWRCAVDRASQAGERVVQVRVGHREVRVRLVEPEVLAEQARRPEGEQLDAEEQDQQGKRDQCPDRIRGDSASFRCHGLVCCRCQKT